MSPAALASFAPQSYDAAVVTTLDLYCTDCGADCTPALVAGEVVLCPQCATDVRVAELLLAV